MGKTYKEKPDKWRHKINHKKPNKHKGNKPRHDEGGGDKKYSPFDDSQSYHESFGG